MTSSSSKLDALLAALESTQPSESQQLLNDQAAKAREQLARGELERPPLRKPKGKDPFGGNWDWLDQPAPPPERLEFLKTLLEDEPAPESAVQLPMSTPSTAWQQKALYSSIGAIAACLLLMLGFLSRKGEQQEGELAMANIEVIRSGIRGGDDKVPEVKIPSAPMDGFLTTIAIFPGNAGPPFVFPIRPDDDIRLLKGEPVSTGRFPDDAAQATAALLVATPTPAADSLEKALARDQVKATADDPEALKTIVREKLKALNFKTYAVSDVKIPAPK